LWLTVAEYNTGALDFYVEQGFLRTIQVRDTDCLVRSLLVALGHIARTGTGDERACLMGLLGLASSLRQSGQTCVEPAVRQLGQTSCVWGRGGSQASSWSYRGMVLTRLQACYRAVEEH
jgi:hypothetical protein